MSNLNERLNQVFEKSTMPKDACDNITQWIHGLPFDKIAKEGSMLPLNNTLVNCEGKPCNLGECLKKHSLILSFNLGGWCPYCTTEKQVLEDYYGQINQLGARVLHISPEVKEFACQCQKENNLKFDSLTDEGGKLGRSLGLVFDITDKKVIQSFEQTGLNFDKFYGKGNNFYTVPATVIVDRKGKIVHMYAPRDHRKRMEPSDILNCLKQCSNIESS